MEMKVNDIFMLSTKNLWQRGIRSWLTILGIVIGVASVVAILSIGSGMKQTISAQLSSMGTDIITILPGFIRIGMGMTQERIRIQAQSATLTEKDIQTIKSINGIKVVGGVISGRANITYLTQTSYANVIGVNPVAWREMSVVEIDYGRQLTQGDSNAIVVGYRIANEMFKKQLTINNRVLVNGKNFIVVGTLKKSGEISGIGYDNAIIMPIDVARTIIQIGKDEYSYIQVKIEDGNRMDEITNIIEEALMHSRHVTEETKDFTVTSAKLIQERVSEVMNTLNLFLGGIAAISLLVGAIGIANTMFMSVMERTRQIGTLKALGATNTEIMEMFLFESGMIGFMGGLIGVFCGFIASGIISEIGIRMIGLAMRGSISITVITPELILFGIGFSILIGIVSGLLPARRAANLQPVEALRYE